MSTISDIKKELRKEIRARKRARTAHELDAMSAIVIERLKAYEPFARAQRVMLYYALPDEVNTHNLVVEMAKVKEVILPTVVGDDIVPVRFNAESELVEGDFHILEPKANEYKGEYDLIVLPGMAFDNHGHRLGRGKGYYDRFLALHANVPTVGICFDFQLLDEVPAEPFDKPVNHVITNK